MLASLLEIGNLSLFKSKLTYRDLKRECIVRGLDFNVVTAADFPTLQNWLLNNMRRDVNIELLDKYDDYIDEQLTKSGKGFMVHPSLRLGYVARDDDDKPKKVKERKPKEDKPQKIKEKTEFGIVKHTKKALTFICQRKGMDLSSTVDEVMKKFPDANEKSIKIWYRKSEREKNRTK